MHPTHTAFAGGRGWNQHLATFASQPEEDGQAGRAGWGAGTGGWQGRMVAHWLAGSGGGLVWMAGQVGWQAGSDGGQGVVSGMNLQSKEFSGMNILS